MNPRSVNPRNVNPRNVKVETAPKIGQRVAATFAAIERERMADVPILNSAVHVEAVGFCSWQEQALGVLITPWFMNLMLLPLAFDGEEARPLGTSKSGDSESVALPCGEVEFLHGYEEGIGAYRMCSLFSPMFDFEDQAAAVATAEAVLNGVLTSPDVDEPALVPAARLSRRELLRGNVAVQEHQS